MITWAYDRAATAAAVEGSGGGGAAARSQQLVVELFGRACRSVLRVDAQELVFEKCVVGSSSVKDFTIWNCSVGSFPVGLRFYALRVIADLPESFQVRSLCICP